MEIHTRSGVDTEILNILEAWKTVYPAKFRFFKSALQNMRQVQKDPTGSWIDRQGREARVSFRVPTELWLFLQYRIPGFGQDHSDVEALLKVAGDMFRASSLRHRRIYSVMDQSKRKKEEDERSENLQTNADIMRDDSSKRREGDRAIYIEPEEERPFAGVGRASGY